jgi:hypothetical protein
VLPILGALAVVTAGGALYLARRPAARRLVWPGSAVAAPAPLARSA